MLCGGACACCPHTAAVWLQPLRVHSRSAQAVDARGTAAAALVACVACCALRQATAMVKGGMLLQLTWQLADSVRFLSSKRHASLAGLYDARTMAKRCSALHSRCAYTTTAIRSTLSAAFVVPLAGSAFVAAPATIGQAAESAAAVSDRECRQGGRDGDRLFGRVHWRVAGAGAECSPGASCSGSVQQDRHPVVSRWGRQHNAASLLHAVGQRMLGQMASSTTLPHFEARLTCCTCHQRKCKLRSTVFATYMGHLSCGTCSTRAGQQQHPHGRAVQRKVHHLQQ